MALKHFKDEEKIPLIVLENGSRLNDGYNQKPVGIFLALTSGILFATYGILVKMFALDVLDVTFARSSFQVAFFGLSLALCSPCTDYTYYDGFKHRYQLFFMLAFQGALYGAVMFSSYLAILHAPFGDAVAIISAHPLVTLILASFIFDQKQSFWKVLLALTMSMGILMIVKPSFIFTQDNPFSEVINFGFIMALISSLAFGLHYTACHSLKAVDPNVLMFWTGLFSLVECGLYAWFYGSNSSLFFNKFDPDFDWAFKLGLLASLGSIGAFTAISAFQTLSPKSSAVLRGQKMIFAYLIQIVLFDSTPGVSSIIGSVLILLSGIMIPLEDILLPQAIKK